MDWVEANLGAKMAEDDVHEFYISKCILATGLSE